MRRNVCVCKWLKFGKWEGNKIGKNCIASLIVVVTSFVRIASNVVIHSACYCKQHSSFRSKTYCCSSTNVFTLLYMFLSTHTSPRMNECSYAARERYILSHLHQHVIITRIKCRKRVERVAAASSRRGRYPACFDAHVNHSFFFSLSTCSFL